MTTERDIKYRAWHKEMKEMLQEVSEWGGGILDQRNDFHNMEDIVLMQYTGLKDFAGNEIYDGDILESIDREDKTVFSIVKLKPGGDFSWDLFIDKSLPCLRTKIIGNIYENPDLIELKKVKNENYNSSN